MPTKKRGRARKGNAKRLSEASKIKLAEIGGEVPADTLEDYLRDFDTQGLIAKAIVIATSK